MPSIEEDAAVPALGLSNFLLVSSLILIPEVLL